MTNLGPSQALMLMVGGQYMEGKKFTLEDDAAWKIEYDFGLEDAATNPVIRVEVFVDGDKPVRMSTGGANPTIAGGAVGEVFYPGERIVEYGNANIAALRFATVTAGAYPTLQIKRSV